MQETFPLIHMGSILVDYFVQLFHPKAYQGQTGIFEKSVRRISKKWLLEWEYYIYTQFGKPFQNMV